MQIIDYLTNRTQFLRLKGCVSEKVVSSTGAPQGTVLSLFLFTLYTSDFQYNLESCHLQKYLLTLQLLGVSVMDRRLSIGNWSITLKHAVRTPPHLECKLKK